MKPVETKTGDITGLPPLEPPHDSEFERLLTLSLEGTLDVYYAKVSPEHITRSRRSSIRNHIRSDVKRLRT